MFRDAAFSKSVLLSVQVRGVDLCGPRVENDGPLLSFCSSVRSGFESRKATSRCPHPCSAAVYYIGISSKARRACHV